MTTIIEAPRTPLSGGWLWYGARTYTLTEWDSTCAGAAAWGMTGVHPKVGDGEHIWYSDAALSAMKQIAANHHLLVAPYYFCYGNALGSSVLIEAENVAHIGSIFGAVCPDMEDQWVNEPAWATYFGQVIRKTFGGLVIPTVYANPQQHPEPITTMNVWANGFLPQVYFNVWTPDTAIHAMQYFLPQWQSLARQVTLKPIMPIIGVGNGLPAQEVINFIADSHSITDYIGFWYDVPYAPYVESVRPHLPRLSSPAPVPTPPPAPTPTPTPPPAKGVIPVTQSPVSPSTQSNPLPIWYQGFSQAQLTSLWGKNGNIPLDPQFAIPSYWARLVNYHPDVPIGSPLGNEHDVVIGGYKWRIQTFEYAGGFGEVSILYDPSDGKTFLYYGSETPYHSTPPMSTTAVPHTLSLSSTIEPAPVV